MGGLVFNHCCIMWTASIKSYFSVLYRMNVAYSFHCIIWLTNVSVIFQLPELWSILAISLLTILSLIRWTSSTFCSFHTVQLNTVFWAITFCSLWSALLILKKIHWSTHDQRNLESGGNLIFHASNQPNSLYHVSAFFITLWKQFLPWSYCFLANVCSKFLFLSSSVIYLIVFPFLILCCSFISLFLWMLQESVFRRITVKQLNENLL